MEQGTLMGLAGIGFVVLLGMLLLGGNESSTAKKRKASLTTGQGTSKGMFSFLKADNGESSRRKQIEQSLGDLESRKKNNEKARKQLKSLLVQADWTVTAQTFTLVSVAIGIVAAGLAFLFKAPIWIVVAAGVVVGFGVPRWILSMAISRRHKKFSHNFSDAMDIIVRGVRTGLPLGDCMKMIAHESPEPIRTEFAHLVEAEAVGVPIETCLDRMYERVPLPEVKFFATVLNIQRSTGGNLGEALANLSNVLRGRKMLREKIKALAAEAKASAIIIGCLPPGVMVLVTLSSPDYMSELYTTSTGHRNLMIGAGMMMAGIFVMRKMINFKF